MERQKKILIVDDDRANAELLLDILKENGYEPVTAGTVEEARAKLGETSPDLIILDLFLPDMLGTDFCSILRNAPATRDVPVIMCTAHQISLEQKIDGFRAGVDDFLIRPFELSELLARMNAVMRRASKPVARAEVISDLQSAIYKMPPLIPAAPPPLPTVPPPSSAVLMRPPPAIKPSSGITERPPLPRLLTRLWQLFTHPRDVFASLSESTDFFIAVALVLGTPLLASLGHLSSSSGGFDAWIGAVSLGLVTNLIMWVSTAGLLNLTLPFLGAHMSMRKSLTLAGCGWAARLVGAALSALYPMIAALASLPDDSDFSAGIDLIPGLPPSAGLSFLGHVGVFDVWCAWLTLVGVWTVCEMKDDRWNAVTLIIGAVCLAFGALTPY